MSRYINADLLKAEFTGNFTNAYTTPLIKAIIDGQPTADVQEVRHGKWITKDLDNFRKVECKCSECGYTGISNYDSYDDPYDFNFCPNCGARMDGKE